MRDLTITATGVFPAVTFHAGALIVSFGDGATNLLAVHRYNSATLELITRQSVPMGFARSDAHLDGPWLAYRTNDETGNLAVLWNLDFGVPVATADKCDGNPPVMIGSGYWAWQRAAAGFPVQRAMLADPTAWTSVRLGAPTGLSRILPDGTVRLIDEDRVVMPGGTIPAFAGDLSVCEAPVGGVLCRLADGRREVVLWTGQDTRNPRCATDGQGHYAVVTWSPQAVRVAVLADGDFTAAVAPPVVVPVPPLVEVPVLPRFSHPMKVGYYYRDTSAIQYGGDNPAAPCNVSIIIDPLALPAEDYAGKPVGMITSVACLTDLVTHPDWWPRWDATYLDAEGDAALLEKMAKAVRQFAAALGLPQKPFLSYTAGYLYPNALTPSDIIGVQLYFDGNQGPADVRALAAYVLPQVAHRRVALICQAYDRAGLYTGDLAALQPVYAEIAEAWPNVEYILWFSDGRKGGTRNHEEIRRWHHATLAACRS